MHLLKASLNLFKFLLELFQSLLVIRLFAYLLLDLFLLSLICFLYRLSSHDIKDSFTKNFLRVRIHSLFQNKIIFLHLSSWGPIFYIFIYAEYLPHKRPRKRKHGYLLFVILLKYHDQIHQKVEYSFNMKQFAISNWWQYEPKLISDKI